MFECFQLLLEHVLELVKLFIEQFIVHLRILKLHPRQVFISQTQNDAFLLSLHSELTSDNQGLFQFKLEAVFGLDSRVLQITEHDVDNAELIAFLNFNVREVVVPGEDVGSGAILKKVNRFNRVSLLIHMHAFNQHELL